MMTCPDPSPDTDPRVPTVMILAGEPSGDIHAADLILEMKKIEPGIRVTAMGGSRMEEAGAQLFFPIDRLSAMGVVEVISQFRQIQQAFRKFRQALNFYRPDLLVLVDYPGFNLRAAAYAKTRHSLPILYYIAPKVWAWNKRRLATIQKYVDHTALIFPFEACLYKKSQIQATYVGNPLMDHLPAACLRPDIGSRLTIGILPGSRPSEVNRLLDTMLAGACIIQDRYPDCRFLISCADSIPIQNIKQILQPYNNRIEYQIIPGNPSPIFELSHLVIAASGTVTLEAALRQVPCILIYKMSPVSYQIARRLVRVKYAGLANLIADQPVMPEFLQKDANPEAIAQAVHDMIRDLDRWTKKLKKIPHILGESGAAQKTACIGISMIKKSGREI